TTSTTATTSTTSISPATPKIKWMSFEEAYALNKTKPKKIFIDMYTDWCGWCKRMDATTFAHPEIIEYMNNNFYNVKMNAERRDTVVIDSVIFVNPNPGKPRSSHQLAVELLRGQMSYPSFVFLNEKSQLLTVVAGYQPAKEFEPILHFFGEDAFTDQKWEEYRAKFQGKVE
ncbi:MAG: DUF255 domain-containing protein, partial [Bacteroidetes bacterium]